MRHSLYPAVYTNSWTFPCHVHLFQNWGSPLVCGAQQQQAEPRYFCHEFVLHMSGESGAPGRCRKGTSALCMSGSHRAEVLCAHLTPLGAEWGKWVLTMNRDQAKLKSQTQPPKHTLGTVPWHCVWDQSLWNHPLPMVGNWSAEALKDLSDTGNLEDPGALPFIEVSVWCFTIKPRLFSEQFSQGLALCVAGSYCNRVGLKIMTFFFWKCDSSREEALHMCRWRNENVQPENRCLFSHTFCFA